MNKLKRIAAGVLALTICLSVAGCGNKKKSDDTSSQAVSGVAVQDHDKQVTGDGGNSGQSETGETGKTSDASAETVVDNPDGEVLYTAMRKLYKADGIHTDIQSTVTLHATIGAKSNDVTIKSNINADLTKAMTHAVYNGSDLYGDSSKNVSYDVWSDYSTTRTYSNRYVDDETGEPVWKFTDTTVVSPGDFNFVLGSYRNAAADGDIISCPLADLAPDAIGKEQNTEAHGVFDGTGMEKGYDDMSIFTESEDSKKAGSMPNTDATPQLGAIQFDETTLAAFSKSVPTDIKRYLETNYYNLDGQISYKLQEGKIVGVTIDKAQKVLADTDINGEKATLVLEFSLNMDIREMKKDEADAVVASLPNLAKSALKSDEKMFVNGTVSDIYSGNAAMLDVAGFKLTIPSNAYASLEECGATADKWTVQDNGGSKALTTSDYPGVIVSLITDAYGQYSSATVDNLKAYIDADNARTVGLMSTGEIDETRFPKLNLTLNGVDFKWGMTDAEVLMVLGDPTALVPLEANRVFDGADLSGSNMVYSVTSGDYIYVISFNVYNKYGLQSYTVTATPKY